MDIYKGNIKNGKVFGVLLSIFCAYKSEAREGRQATCRAPLPHRGGVRKKKRGDVKKKGEVKGEKIEKERDLNL
jgi:hypothetical protein